MQTKVIVLIALIFMMSIPPVNAQVPTAAVSISCSPAEIQIPVYPGANSTGSTICTASNPTQYEEKISLSVTSDGLHANLSDGDLIVPPGSEVDFEVSVELPNQTEPWEAQLRSLVVQGSVQEINGVPPANQATSGSSMIVSLLQYHNHSMEITNMTNELTVLTDRNFHVNANVSINVNVTNHGNRQDDIKVGIDQESRESLSLDNLQINIPLSKLPVNAFANSSFNFTIGTTNDTNFSSWDLLENGTSTNVYNITVYTESDFGCKQGNCDRKSETILLRVFAVPGLDSDDDGVIDSFDAFPNDPDEILDSDEDGVGDNGDAFPFDKNETSDDDNDGVGNNADRFPNDSSEWNDTDNDGVGDNSDIAPDNPKLSSLEIEDSLDTSSILIAGSISLLAVAILISSVTRARNDKYRENEITYKSSEIFEKQPRPSFETVGELTEDGYEFLEYPDGSGQYWWKDLDKQMWQKWQ